jgi:DNA-binding response OmpR family regulator
MDAGRTGEAAGRPDLRALVERAPDIVYRYRLHPTLGFDYVSAAATRIHGRTPEEHYGDPELPFKMVHPDDRAVLEERARSGPLPATAVLGGLRIDLADQSVFVKGRPARLSPAEFRLLAILTERPGVVVPREELIRGLRAGSQAGNGHACEAAVSTLRAKIERTPHLPERIVTVRGRGYKFVAV